MTTPIQSNYQTTNAAAIAANDSSPPTSQASTTSNADLLSAPLTSVSMGGDVGAQIAALVMLSANGSQKNAEATKEAADAAADKEEAAQVQSLRDAASATKASGILSGVTDIASGALTAASAAYSISADQSKAAGEAATAGGTKLADANAAASASRMATAYKAGAALGDGLGKITTAVVSGNGDDAKADGAAHKNTADTARRASDQANDQVKDAQKMIDVALSFYKEYTESQGQATSAALHRS
jgi:hypothetical protein